MTELATSDDGVSRRNLFLGLGAAAGAGAAFAAFPGSVDASALLPQVPPRPQVLVDGPPVGGDQRVPRDLPVGCVGAREALDNGKACGGEHALHVVC